MALPPTVSGAKRLLGHTAEFLRDPDGLIRRGLAEHGTIFSVRLPGRPGVVLLGPDHARFMFAETDKRLSIKDAYPFFLHMFGKAYFLAEPEEYRRQREILLPQFSGKHIAGHLDLMERKATQFIDDLPDHGEFDLVEAFGPLIIDITAGSFLGENVPEKLDGFFDVFRRFSEGMDPVLPGWVPAPHLVRSHRARDRLRKLAKGLLKERRENPLAEPDFLQTLATAVYADTNEPVPDDVLVAMAIMLVWVGHETTVGHLSWAVIDLLKHQLELKKVTAEVENAQTVDMKNLRRFEYLDRALHETERLHPVTNGVVRKAVEPIEHAGYTIPKGAVVVLHPGHSHRLGDVFPRPDEFLPERFKDEPKKKHALYGFGGGFHRCLGENFAYTEMKVIMTRLLQRLDLELIDTDPKPEPGQANNWPQSPCRVRYQKKSVS
ncbi:cytochrome P450 [Lentzea tibetensis]|uniref:Cytochrome P450 n=1 Tax=Lentzea tibetensis TaxID=2591470 RepID=A0A563EVZ5_9PSEU|nr:cytochrome P450 [Lentzea tibetensis]TWP51866.1 cytochrome P450 [Lentzea tibetensis]